MFGVWPFRPFSRVSTTHRAQQGPIPVGTDRKQVAMSLLTQILPALWAHLQVPLPRGVPLSPSSSELAEEVGPEEGLEVDWAGAGPS